MLARAMKASVGAGRLRSRRAAIVWGGLASCVVGRASQKILTLQPGTYPMSLRYMA
jgi:hypothetical protein